MGGIIQETIRERQQHLGPVDLQLENLQLRQRFDFASREIHPMERRCEGCGGILGPVFYSIARGSRIKDWVGTGKRSYKLICPTCHSYQGE